MERNAQHTTLNAQGQTFTRGRRTKRFLFTFRREVKVLDRFFVWSWVKILKVTDRNWGMLEERPG
jgi:hypothetical protein